MSDSQKVLSLARRYAQASHQMARELKSRDAASRDVLRHAAVEGLDLLCACKEYLEAHASEHPWVSHLQAIVAESENKWTRMGIVADGVMGEAFDPARHRAIRESETHGSPGRVVERVLTPGIVCLGERVRRADVVVSKKG